MIAIRDWTEKDLPKLMALERACFADAWTTEMMKNEFTRDVFCGVLAEDDGVLVGYVCGYTLFEDAELFKIAVMPDCRGKGIGGLLLDAFAEKAATKGAERIFLEVRISNEPALGLYLSRGFEKTRVRKRYYSDGEDALEMKRDLCPKA
ncbi:MAG: ribosomal protein S18-alanine N-acetyltransferase [Clostridia bacterium]|nr:ribosomal protein S18-alanine N-acetyltransferase [Clostridia bacterium]MBQ8447005.1 ribosomal protein S18-alanine N-acetyltransferase [Clostridia bacterium]